MEPNARNHLHICQPGYEHLLEGELTDLGATPLDRGRGWVLASGELDGDPCFSHLALLHCESIGQESVNAIATRLLEGFMEQVRGTTLPDSWPMLFRFADGITGLGQRTKAVEKEFRNRLKKRMARLERTATDELPRGGGPLAGCFVFFADYGQCRFGTEAWAGGQARMADDPAAPSRSYLKTEEAFAAMGREPKEGESCVDLGAAPGGWSYSAAKRGATVLAIDNGPMKGGAKDHPLIEHRRADAFRFMPADGESYDWLLCDLVEEPHHVMRLIEQWLKNKHCRSFVVNLKFGRADALKLVREIHDPKGRILPYCSELRVRHLFHDRDELTLMGSVR